MSTSVIPMQAGSIGPLVDRNYRASHTFQWVRELVVNSLQAGATEINITTDWEGVRALGVHRRLVYDNGTGIPREMMERFLAKFGGSGKTIGDTTENFGVGFKTSTLPWNKYGVVAISRHQGVETMMWLQHVEISDGPSTYGARVFDIGNENGVPSSVVPLSEMGYEDDEGNFVPEFIEDGVDWTNVFPGDHDGFCVVLLGDHPDQHTVKGDPNRDEMGKYSIVHYLNSRLWRVPEGVTIHVDQYENWSDPTTWPTDRVERRQRRQPVGMMRQIERASELSSEVAPSHSGKIEVPAGDNRPGATIHWWLVGSERDSRGDITTLPLAGVIFASHDGIEEVFDLRGKGSGHHLSRMNRFVRVSQVRDRLAIIVEPHAGDGIHIFPEQSRTDLRFESPTQGGMRMDWEWWVSAWHSDLPNPVRKAIDAYYQQRANASGGLSEDDYRRLGQRYLSLLRRTVEGMFPNRKGEHVGKGSYVGANEGRGGRRRRRQMNPTDRPGSTPRERGGDNEIRQRTRKATVGMVEAIFDEAPEETWSVRFDVESNRAIINRSSHSYQRAMSAILETQVAKRGSLDESREILVRNAVETAMTAVVSTCLTEVAAEVALRPAERDELISDNAVSTILMGIMHIERVADGYIGTALSPAKRTA